METSQIIEGLEIAHYIAGALAVNTAISETLPFLKKYKSNGTFDLLLNIGKMVFNFFKKNSGA